MGAVESSAGGLLQRLLMPAPGEAEVFGRGSRDFPEAHADSLLLLGHVRLAVPDAEAARRFYVEGLGARLRPSGGGPLSVAAGPSALQLPASAPEGGGPGTTWPGQLYVWVEDIRKTLSDCQDLANRLSKQVDEIVEEVHRVTAEDAVDALLIRDPVGGNLFLVNQAPAKLVEKMRCLGRDDGEESTAPNLLAIVDAAHAVPQGRAAAAARFYSHFLGAAVTKRDGGYCSGPGYSVHFSFGDRLRQTLTFLEEADDNDAGQAEPPQGICEVCLYMPSEERFQAAFTRCAAAGLVDGPNQTWEAVNEAREFTVSRCYDPGTQTDAIELGHVIRHPQHPDLPTTVATPSLAEEV